MARKRRKSKAEVQPTDDDTSGEGNASSKASKRNRKRRPKKRKKNRARAAEKELATGEGAKKERTEVPGPIADLDLSVDLGDSELRGDDAISKLLAETAALDDQASGQPEVVDIDPPDEDEPLVENLDDDLEDDLDPAAARERLIAEALAFIEGEEELTPEELATDDSGVFERGSSDIVAVEAASDAPEGSLDADDATLREGSARLKIGPDALAAIKQLRKEGLASHSVDNVLDLGQSGTPEDGDRIVAAALAYSAMQEATYRVPVTIRRVRRWKGMAASVIFFVALIVAASPPGFVVPDPPARLTEADRLYGVRVALILQSQQVEAFRTREQRLPDSLDEVAARFPGVRFVKSGSRLYQLVAHTAAGEAIIYDSAAPAREFAVISRSWSTTRDAP